MTRWCSLSARSWFATALHNWPATKRCATRIWASELRTFLILTVDGVTNGFVYAIVALALVMIWRATRVINYAQGAMGMFTTYVTLFAISHGVTYWLAFVIALGGGFLLGAAIERVLVRPLETRPPLHLVILTLGL